MPMTPWHLGPGLLGKALLRGSMSLTAFTVVQVMMDAEVVARIVLGIRPIHGWTHTLVGGTVTGAAAVAVTAAGVSVVRRFVGPRASFLMPGANALLLGAGWGVVSHLLLDALMHHDVRLFWPVTNAAPLDNRISLSAIHDICFWSGVVGAFGWLAWAAVQGFQGRRRAASVRLQRLD